MSDFTYRCGYQTRCQRAVTPADAGTYCQRGLLAVRLYFPHRIHSPLPPSPCRACNSKWEWYEKLKDTHTTRYRFLWDQSSMYIYMIAVAYTVVLYCMENLKTIPFTPFRVLVRETYKFVKKKQWLLLNLDKLALTTEKRNNTNTCWAALTVHQTEKKWTKGHSAIRRSPMFS